MKDFVITQKSIKRELWILCLCAVAAYGCNIYAIIAYSRPLTELYSTIGYVIFFAIILYITQWIVRLIVLLLKWCCLKLFKKLESKK